MIKLNWLLAISLAIASQKVMAQETLGHVSDISREHLLLIQDNFIAMLSGNNPSAEAWLRVGISMEEDANHITLISDGEKLRGAGKTIVLKDEINATAEENVAGEVKMLQIPHQFYDKHTGSIGRFLQSRGHFKVYMENEIQRYRTENADMTHQSNSLFVAFAEAFTMHYEDGRVIQIHGFNSHRRKTQAGKYADSILSNGTKYPTPYLRSLQSCYRDSLGLVTRVYGLDVTELGATTNKVGRKLNLNDLGHFIHVELSHDVRENYKDEQWLGSFAKCF